MTLRLSRVDESSIADHTRLGAEDQCFYLYEYTSGRNFSFSSTNNLINNLKKKPTSSQAQLGYKAGAINECATRFRETLNPLWLQAATLVPVPGSKAADDPDFDDRMTKVCRGIRTDQDVRALVRQTASLRASHEVGDGDRVSVAELLAAYEIDESLSNPGPTAIGIVDDVLTAGTHYRAMHTVLSARFPGVPIIGLFVARRIFPPIEF